MILQIIDSPSGAVGRAFDSGPEGHEFEPHGGGRFSECKIGKVVNFADGTHWYKCRAVNQ